MFISCERWAGRVVDQLLRAGDKQFLAMAVVVSGDADEEK